MREKPTLSTQLRANRCLIIILVVAFALRLAAALYFGDRMEVIPAGGTHDQVSYDQLAYRVATGHGFTFPTYWYPWVEPNTPTSYYSGTMVLHLAAIYYVFGYHPLIARILYALLGTATCYLIYSLGRRLFGASAGLAAAALAACYSYLIVYSATLLTETPFMFCLFLALNVFYDLAERYRARSLVLLSVGLAGMVLFRMAALPFVLVLLALLFIKSHGTKLRTKLARLLVPIAIIGLAVAPWTARNYLLYGRFMLLESQFGHVFWNSNHPDRGSTFGEVAWLAPIPEELSHLNEADLTYELLRRGQQNVLRDPVRFLLLTLSRFKVFFMFWPSAESSLVSNIARVFSFGISLPFMIYGVILSILQWRKCVLLYLFLVIHYGVYLISWVMIRYRVPADAVLIVFASAGLVDLRRRFAAWRMARLARRIC